MGNSSTTNVLYFTRSERNRVAIVGRARWECEAERSQDHLYDIAVGYLWSISEDG